MKAFIVKQPQEKLCIGNRANRKHQVPSCLISDKATAQEVFSAVFDHTRCHRSNHRLP